MIDAFPRPDFVVVGTTYNGSVVLLASKTLTDVELREEVERVRLYQQHLPINEVKTIVLTAQMDDYLWVSAPTYPEAWAGLFRQWSPGGSAELIQGRLEIGP